MTPFILKFIIIMLAFMVGGFASACTESKLMGYKVRSGRHALLYFVTLLHLIFFVAIL
jgi:hypothetical protein